MPRSPAAHATLRRKRFALDLHRCVKCHETRWIELHHINGYADSAIESSRTLCYWCHLVAPEGEQYYAWETSGRTGRETVFHGVARSISEANSAEGMAMLNSLIDLSADMRVESITAGTISAVQRARREGRIGGRKRKIFDRDKLRELGAAGVPMRDIAAQLNISAASVCRILKAS